MRHRDDIIDFIRSDGWIMSLLSAHQTLGAPDSWIAAGAIRNPVWAKLHGIAHKPELENDVDVIYFDSSPPQDQEEVYRQQLKALQPEVNWEVRNQARMHIRNHDAPYRDSYHALEHWAETATAIGVRFNGDEIELLTPYGVDDLLGMIVRPTPKFTHKRQIYEKRISDKAWQKKWPRLTILYQP